VRTCFPTTPQGWLPVVPPTAGLRSGGLAIHTDGERVRLDREWQTAAAAAPGVAKVIAEGASAIPLQAPGTCLILQRDRTAAATYTAVMMDPGYLAPTGVETTITAPGRAIRSAVDLVTGVPVPIAENGCRLRIEPGAFRILRVELRE
jgi:hypothetical protein